MDKEVTTAKKEVIYVGILQHDLEAKVYRATMPDFPDLPLVEDRDSAKAQKATIAALIELFHHGDYFSKGLPEPEFKKPGDVEQGLEYFSVTIKEYFSVTIGPGDVDPDVDPDVDSGLDHKVLG